MSDAWRGLARITKTFRIEVGEFRAVGVPAVVLSLGGLIVAAGAAGMLRDGATALPEAIRELRGLMETRRERRALEP